MLLYHPLSALPGAEAHDDPALYRCHVFVERDTRDAATGKTTGAPPKPGSVTTVVSCSQVAAAQYWLVSEKARVRPLRSEIERRMEEIWREEGQFDGKDKRRTHLNLPQEIWVRLRVFPTYTR